MNIGMYLFLAVVIITIVYGIFLYNRLVAMKHGVSKSWANIDVLLKQRHDELPKLVDACRRYMQHEQETLERVMAARSAAHTAGQRGDVSALGNAETAMRASLGQLFAVVENYPELKADESFQHLQRRISGLEESIADRREFYNESVNLYNIRIEQLPDVMLAKPLGYRPAALLEFDDTELTDPSVKQLFSE